MAVETSNHTVEAKYLYQIAACMLSRGETYKSEGNFP